MAGKAGQRLSEEEVREFAAYHNAHLPQPEKFDGVVVENTTAQGPVYRYQTDEEAKANKAASEAARKEIDETAALNEKVRQEAIKRGVEVPPPPPPDQAVPVKP
jgi:DNA-directed RNA polymerase subunit L